MSTKPTSTIDFHITSFTKSKKFGNEVSKNSKLRLLFSILHIGCPGLEPGTSRME